MSSGPIYVEFTSKERMALRELAKLCDMTEGNVVRAALRHYQMVKLRIVEGRRLAWINQDGTEHVEEVGGCMGDDDASGVARP